MNKFLVLILFLGACTAETESPTTSDPTLSTTEPTTPDGLDAGFADPPAVSTSGGLDPAIENEIGSLIASIEAGGFDAEALDAISAGEDPRVAWFLADLLRFFQGGSEGAQTARVFAALTGLTPDTTESPAFVDAFNHLIAWDLPAWDGYGTRKGELYTILEPAWQPFFDDNVSIDWRWVTWGGVLIDDRPLGDANPCERGCIPALDDPPTVAGDEVTWLADSDIVFGVVHNGDALAMPRNQMEVHEMLNLSVGGDRLGIPYCTLCGSAQAYLTESVPEGFETAVLRTSGLLSRSNKVMYDLVTGSVFNTFTGEALSGPLGQEGVVLDQVTVVASTWGEWFAENPDTRVIARDGGLGRTYEQNPLGDRDADGPIFPVGPVDPRLEVHARVVGVVGADGTPIAFPVASATNALDMGDPVTLHGHEVIADGAGCVWWGLMGKLSPTSPSGSPGASSTPKPSSGRVSEQQWNMERAKTLPAAGELESLESFLDFQRATMVQKAEGVTDDQGGSKPVEPSSLSLSGLIKHLALVEESWFQSVFAGGDLGEPWSSAPFDDDDDWEFNSASGDRISDLIDMYEKACEKSRQVVAGADSLDQLSAKVTHRGRVSLRWILLHMIEETARHAGHADLIRERIDGTTGI